MSVQAERDTFFVHLRQQAHWRCRIEEAFKQLKHRLSLEHVSGLSQHVVMQDVAAKIFER
ncbi:hypothetical protein [Actimicrobium sp. CCI2.3]|uniref:hypothetical protein n=1 Tax=Actimicrobium sp. CCI2.3 TaxID=3048616 RepID=UPI002AB5891A|nr:hypothetical protein [Actimicrobium sp. CCI2.3]MDY7574602.1 hypothetical protein [Actimicrobium sp. CCI2.3]MEB0023899.1 hypothetical protein [Actimicrobium sp. CCI2.3]